VLLEDYNVELIEKAISVSLFIIKDFMLFPGKVETWNIIIQTDD